MLITRDDSRHDLLGPSDDAFHAPQDYAHLFPVEAMRWFHETAWFFWFVPEAGVGGWLYNWVRPNIGTTGGGAWVWDASSFLHVEVPYYACYSNLAYEPGSDLRDHRFPSGVSVRCVEPLTSYVLAVRDRDRLALDLRFDAVAPPWVGSVNTEGGRETATHLDQLGRVHGTVLLNGRHFDVDCVAMRDRTWSVRPERWKDGHVGYASAGNENVGFLVNSAEGMRGLTEERIYSGFLALDGRRARLVDGTRILHRHPAHGYLERIEIDATDADGRRLVATGTSVSRMAMPIPGVHGVVWTSLVDWDIDGEQVWGEDQDAWPIHGWSAFRRSSSGV